jgi:hypothetical protein
LDFEGQNIAIHEKHKDDVLDTLPGARGLIFRYGTALSFHDAEIISLNLCRAGFSTLTLQPFPPNDPNLVHFDLETVTDLEIADFRSQNVISSVLVERGSGTNSKPVLRITLGPCYGLCGWIEAEDISVRVS